MDRVLDRIWIGASSDLDGGTPFHALGFSGVVDLRDGAHEKDFGVESYRLVNRDGDPWNSKQVQGAFAFIHDHVRTGKVLVACAAGMSRSAAIVIGYLVRCGWGAAEAYAAVKAVRPRICPVGKMVEAVLG